MAVDEGSVPELRLGEDTIVHVVGSTDECDRILNPLWEIFTARTSAGGSLAYGIDTEWSDRETVALVQIALPTVVGDEIVLIRMNRLEGRFPESLVKILTATSTVAVGVGVENDLRLIRRQWPGAFAKCSFSRVDGGLFLDLSSLASVVEVFSTKGDRKRNKSVGLDALARAALGHRLDKDPVVRCGDWAAEFLSPRQVSYAALDARVGLDIFEEMGHRMSRDSSSRDSPVRDFCNAGAGWCSRFIRSAWDGMNSPVAERNESQISSAGKEGVSLHLQADGTGSRAPKAKKAPYFVPKTRSHYDGCRMHAPDGRHLANITARRADWYVRSSLATLLCEGPHDAHACSIRLMFEPKGGLDQSGGEGGEGGEGAADGRAPSHHSEGDDFQRVDRFNICVGCGSGCQSQGQSELSAGSSIGSRVGNGESNGGTGFKFNDFKGSVVSNKEDDPEHYSETGLNRFSIVPHCFRRHLPVAVKTRSSHDIVLLCRTCRDKAQVFVTAPHYFFSYFL